MPFVVFWIKKWMHGFHGLCQYPYCSIIPLILIFLCKLHSLLLQQCYTCHILFLALNLKTDFLSPSWISGEIWPTWWQSMRAPSTPYLKELTPPRLLFPLYLLQSFYFIFMIIFFYCFVIPMIRTMAWYVYSFWFYWFFSFFRFFVNFPDWFLLLFSLNFYFSLFGLGYSSCTSF